MFNKKMLFFKQDKVDKLSSFQRKTKIHLTKFKNNLRNFRNECAVSLHDDNVGN